MSEKKEIRIPRLWVYVSAFFAGLVVTTGFGLAFGVEYALDLVTNCAIYSVLSIAAYNVFDKVDRQPYRLTAKYWVLMALIVVTDFLFLFAAKADTKDLCVVRLCIFAVSLILTGFYAYFIYAPSQVEIVENVKNEAKNGIAQYLNEHGGEAPETLAEGILALIFAPKVKEPKPKKERKTRRHKKGEEADE